MNDPALNPTTAEPATVDAVNRRFMKLLRAKGTPLAKVWSIFAVLGLALTGLSALIQIRSKTPMLHQMFDQEVMQAYLMHQQQAGFDFLTLAIYPAMLVMMVLYYASVRVARAVDAGEAHTFGDATALLTARFLPTMLTTLIMYVAVFVGSMCCLVPGLIAMFFLYLAPYLTARGDSIGEALQSSIGLAKRNVVLLVMICGIGAVAGFGFVVIQTAAIAMLSAVLGESGLYAGHLVCWAVSYTVGYFLWLYTASVVITIDRSEA